MHVSTLEHPQAHELAVAVATCGSVQLSAASHVARQLQVSSSQVWSVAQSSGCSQPQVQVPVEVRATWGRAQVATQSRQLQVAKS